MLTLSCSGDPYRRPGSGPGFDPGDGVIRRSGVGGEFVVTVEDAEVGVFDQDRDDLSGMSGGDAQSLASDHDHAVAGDAAFGALSGAWRQGRRVVGLACADQLEALFEGDPVGP